MLVPCTHFDSLCTLRHHAALAVATRQATAAMAAALQRRGSLSLRLTAALSGWDGHYLLAHAIQVQTRWTYTIVCSQR